MRNGKNKSNTWKRIRKGEGTMLNDVKNQIYAVMTLMVLVVLGSNLSGITVKAYSYNADKAIQYAAAHYRDSDSKQCAEFVSNCVQAGGLGIQTKLATSYVCDEISRVTGVQRIRLQLNAQGYPTQALDGNILEKGDVVMQYCYGCSLGPHILICAGYDASGNAVFYGHNNPSYGTYNFRRHGWHTKSSCDLGACVMHISKNHEPDYCLDYCKSAGVGKVFIAGWTYDRDVPSQSNSVHVYIGGPAGTSGTELFPLAANQTRDDVNRVKGITGKHGFSITYASKKKGKQEIYVYAINLGEGNNNPVIGHTTVDFGNNIPEKLTVKQAAAKQEYEIGDALDTKGLVLATVYTSGAETKVTNGFKTSYDFSSAGDKTVTVTYTEAGRTLSTTYTVKVNSPQEDKTEEPDKATTEEPNKATTEEPDKATTEEPDKATTEEPDKATTEEPDKATMEEPDKTTTEEPDKGKTEESDKNQNHTEEQKEQAQENDKTDAQKDHVQSDQGKDTSDSNAKTQLINQIISVITNLKNDDEVPSQDSTQKNEEKDTEQENIDTEADDTNQAANNMDEENQRLATPSFRQVKKNGRKVTLTIRKVANAGGYELQYAAAKNMKKSTVRKIGSTKAKYTTKKLKKGKTYYFRVRAYKIVNGATYYSNWSAKQKVKIKK